MMKRASLLVFLCIILSMCLFISVVNGQAYKDISTTDMLVEIEKLKIQLDLIEKQLSKIENAQDLIEEEMGSLNIRELEADSSITRLINEIDSKYQVMQEKYDARLGVLGFWQNTLNTIMVFGGLIIAFLGVSSVSDYRKRIIREKIEESIKDDVLNKALDKLEGEIKGKIFEKYSNDLNSLSARIEILEQFEPIIEVLRGMKKNG
jgi:parvulin-like peptidyl-prolyl isomerase